MEHFRLMRVEDIGRLEGNFAETQPGAALLSELDRIGQRANPREGGFQRRMLRLAGYDLGIGLSLDPGERAVYVAAVNRLIAVWNTFGHIPSLEEYEAAVRASLSISADIQ
jgi:hypothetical protein